MVLCHASVLGPSVRVVWFGCSLALLLILQVSYVNRSGFINVIEGERLDPVGVPGELDYRRDTQKPLDLGEG